MEFALKIATVVLYVQAVLFTLFMLLLGWMAIDSGRWPINFEIILFGIGAVTSFLVAHWKSTKTLRHDEARRIARAERRAAKRTEG